MSGLLTWGLGLGGQPPSPSGTNLKQVLVDALKSNPQVAAIVGARVYPDTLPTSATLPSLDYSFVGADHVESLSGPAGAVVYRVRFVASSLLASDCEAIREAVRLQFAGFKGFLGSVYVMFVDPETGIYSEIDKYVPPLPGSDNGTHTKLFDFKFKIRESVPTF